MNEKTKKEIIRHAKSAALTFASIFAVEVSLAMHSASDWSEIGWGPLASTASFTAARAALKFLVGK